MLKYRFLGITMNLHVQATWIVWLGIILGLTSCHRFEGGFDVLISENPIAYSSESIERGRKTYQHYCVACHGKSGKGDGLAAPHYNPRPTDLTIIGISRGGATAQTILYGDGAMPAWKTVLKQKEAWDIVNYLKSLQTDQMTSVQESSPSS